MKGVRALSRVRDLSKVLGMDDYPRPVLTDPILFHLTCEERVPFRNYSGTPWLRATCLLARIRLLATSPISS